MQIKKEKLISVILVTLIIFNVLFPCISIGESEQEIVASFKEEFKNKVLEKIKEYKATGESQSSAETKVRADINRELNDETPGGLFDVYRDTTTYNTVRNATLDYNFKTIFDNNIVEITSGVVTDNAVLTKWVTEYYDGTGIEQDLREKVEAGKIKDKILNYIDSQYYNGGRTTEALDKMTENDWYNELITIYNFENTDENTCKTYIKEAINKAHEEYDIFDIEDIETAKIEFMNILAEMYTKKKKELEDSGITGEETINIALQQYFEQQKSNCEAQTGEIYDSVTKIANRIKYNNVKQLFLTNCSAYIEEYIKQHFGKKLSSEEGIINASAIVLDSVAGVLLFPFKILQLILPSVIIQGINTLLASIGTESGALGINQLLTLDNIFFNKVALTNIDIFNFKTAGYSPLTGEKNPINVENNAILTIRQTVAKWYYAIRNLAIAFSLLVLIYIGIKMATSTIAEDKAKYKKMLKDWLVSFILIFILQYIIVFTISINNSIVDILEESRKKVSVVTTVAGDIGVSSIQDRLLIESFNPLFTKGMISSILYIMINVMTFLFLIVYLKRLLTICVLTIVSPIITVTYAIDKAGDRKGSSFK